MKTQFNEAREIVLQRDSHIPDIPRGYDPGSLFVNLSRMPGERRTKERTDYSHFLLNSAWIMSGIFRI